MSPNSEIGSTAQPVPADGAPVSARPTLRLRVTGLSKDYGAVRALNAVGFDLRPGEIMALLGENGAGKSTLVKTLAGLVDPDEGDIEVNGEPTSLYPVSASQAAGIAVVHQEYSSIPALSIAENLVLGSKSAGLIWRSGAAVRRARKLLAAVGLPHLDPRTPIEKLTVAEEQLVEIARVLSRNAQIVIFDEPTAALADKDIQRVLEVIRRLAAEGRSIIYVTHRLPEVFKIADRVTVFRNGNSLPPVDIKDVDPKSVVTMMLGREQNDLFPARAQVFGKPLLSVQNLTATGLTSPVSFDIRPGEIVGLTGQLGSGADTVAQALSGLVRSARGDVAIDGRTYSLRGRASGIKHGVAYCSPNRKADGIFANKPVYQNLSSPWLRSTASAGLLRRRKERSKANSIGAGFAIDVDRMSSSVANLSGGNQQKVVLGKWLGISPKILIVEEPTRGVDIGARADIYQRLRNLCAGGVGILVVSSDTTEIEGLCDTIGAFYRGRLTAMRPADEWTIDSLVLEVMHSNLETAS